MRIVTWKLPPEDLGRQMEMVKRGEMVIDPLTGMPLRALIREEREATAEEALSLRLRVNLMK